MLLYTHVLTYYMLFAAKLTVRDLKKDMTCFIGTNVRLQTCLFCVDNLTRLISAITIPLCCFSISKGHSTYDHYFNISCQNVTTY